MTPSGPRDRFPTVTSSLLVDQTYPRRSSRAVASVLSHDLEANPGGSNPPPATNEPLASQGFSCPGLPKRLAHRPGPTGRARQRAVASEFAANSQRLSTCGRETQGRYTPTSRLAISKGTLMFLRPRLAAAIAVLTLYLRPAAARLRSHPKRPPLQPSAPIQSPIRLPPHPAVPSRAVKADLGAVRPVSTPARVPTSSVTAKHSAGTRSHHRTTTRTRSAPKATSPRRSMT